MPCFVRTVGELRDYLAALPGDMSLQAPEEAGADEAYIMFAEGLTLEANEAQLFIVGGDCSGRDTIVDSYHDGRDAHLA